MQCTFASTAARYLPSPQGMNKLASLGGSA
jgi:hypothetical protein